MTNAQSSQISRCFASFGYRCPHTAPDSLSCILPKNHPHRQREATPEAERSLKQGEENVKNRGKKSKTPFQKGLYRRLYVLRLRCLRFVARSLTKVRPVGSKTHRTVMQTLRMTTQLHTTIPAKKEVGCSARKSRQPRFLLFTTRIRPTSPVAAGQIKLPQILLQPAAAEGNPPGKASKPQLGFPAVLGDCPCRRPLNSH